MIPLTKYVLFTMLPALPCEYVIDYGPAAVPYAYEMILNFEARDGTNSDDQIWEWAENTDPNSNRTVMVGILQTAGWEVRSGPGNSLIVSGRSTGKKSPIKSVTLKSDKVIPVQVRWVPLVPEKKK
jgi:hypothetical protein